MKSNVNIADIVIDLNGKEFIFVRFRDFSFFEFWKYKWAKKEVPDF